MIVIHQNTTPKGYNPRDFHFGDILSCVSWQTSLLYPYVNFLRFFLRDEALHSGTSLLFSHDAICVPNKVRLFCVHQTHPLLFIIALSLLMLRSP